MATIRSFKTTCIIIAIAGLITAGICVWLLAFPPKIDIAGVASLPLELGNSPKLGMAVAVLMILVGILACVVNLDKYVRLFAVPLLIGLVLAIACLGVAIKDHQDCKKMKDLLNFSKQSGGFNTGTGNFGRPPQYGRQVQLPFDESFLDKLMLRLIIMAVCAAMDCIVQIIAIILIWLVRKQTSTRTVMQMERTL